MEDTEFLLMQYEAKRASEELKKITKANEAINQLKTRGYEDSKNIAIVLEYIMGKLK